MATNIEDLAEMQNIIRFPQGLEGEKEFHAADPCSDVENGVRFWRIAGDDTMFVQGIGWFKWSGVRWELDPQEPFRVGQCIGATVAQEASEILADYDVNGSKSDRDKMNSEVTKLTRHIKYSESMGAIRAAITLAESTKPVQAELLDTHPLLFNCANGTVDLKTGKMVESNRLDYLTKASPINFNPSARCPEWEKTLLEIFQGKTHIIKFVQRMVGYAMTGSIREQVFFLLFGEGANGKDVFLNRIRNVLGEYAGEIAPEVLIQTRNAQHPTAIFDLRGKRLGMSSETGEGKPLDETRVKQITGNDRLKARGMRQDFIEFTNETKVIIATNHLPQVQGDDYAIWRRIQLIPFNRIFKPEERDESLGQRLDETELEGILNWCIEGCLEWQRIGLAPPAEIKDATAAYRSDQDVLKEFFEYECEFGRGKQATSKAIFSRWSDWCNENDETPHSQKWLAPRLKRRGCRKRSTRSGVIWENISLKPNQV